MVRPKIHNAYFSTGNRSGGVGTGDRTVVKETCSQAKTKEDFNKDYHKLLLKTAGKTAGWVQAQAKREVFGIDVCRYRTWKTFRVVHGDMI